jgi:hypothetical protein
MTPNSSTTLKPTIGKMAVLISCLFRRQRRELRKKT